MSLNPSGAPDHPPTPTPASQTRRGGTQGCIKTATLITVIICAVAALVWGPPLAQGVPNPLFLQRVTYMPEQGPASPILLDSRPETVAYQYVTDYLRLAGTFPCESDPNPYVDFRDQLLRTGQCRLAHPVASFAINSVTIQSHGLLSASSAIIRLTVLYHDGSKWSGTIGLGPSRWQGPPPLSTHLTCWGSFGTLILFGHLTPDIPLGAEYTTGDMNSPVYHCKA